MTILDKLAAAAAELHLAGFGSEMTEGLKRVSTVIAGEVHDLTQRVAAIAPAAAGDVAAKLEELVKAEVAKLQPEITGQITGLVASSTAETQKLIGALQDSVDAHVRTLFGQLLAKAAADDAAKVAPAAPVATEAPVQASDAGGAAPAA